MAVPLAIVEVAAQILTRTSNFIVSDIGNQINLDTFRCLVALSIMAACFSILVVQKLFLLKTFAQNLIMLNVSEDGIK